MRLIYLFFSLPILLIACKEKPVDPVPPGPDLVKAERIRSIGNIIPYCVGGYPETETELTLTFALEDKDIFQIDSIVFSENRFDHMIEKTWEGSKDSLLVKASHVTPAGCLPDSVVFIPEQPDTVHSIILYFKMNGIPAKKEYTNVTFNPDLFAVTYPF